MSELAPAADGIEDEDLIEREDMVITVTMGGYIKRTPLALFREQKRGGKGRAGMATKEEDAVTNLFVTSTHNPVLFFSNLGRVYRMKVWKLPEGGPNTRGRPMVNLLPLAQGETISTVLPLPEDETEYAQRPFMPPPGASQLLLVRRVVVTRRVFVIEDDDARTGGRAPLRGVAPTVLASPAPPPPAPATAAPAPAPAPTPAPVVTRSS